MRQILIALFIIVSTKIDAQNYTASLIPDSLKENADAVIRLDEREIIVKSTHKAVIKYRKVITVLNEEGNKDATFFETYDDFSKLSDISLTLLDAAGAKIKTIKKKDIADISAYDGLSLATDDRAKRFDFFYRTYPYTVIHEYEIEKNGIYQFEIWMPVYNRNISLQKATYLVNFPEGYKIRSKQLNMLASPQITNTSCYWEIQNVKAITGETFQPELFKLVPIVFATPEIIDYAKYNGISNTWQEYGKFNLSLNEGRDVLPTEIIQKVHELTDKLSTTQEKINVLYDFLQKNTRYISIQLGIGGLQPFDATFVAQKRYGDCKALSNYMVSLLKEAGIKSYYSTIRAGDGEEDYFFEDFPYHYSNHIVTCVPLGKDTTWLECTSQTKSPGYMGKFTGNRKALLITENGGVLANTPQYLKFDNLQLRKVNATVSNEGNLTANVKTIFTGIQQEETHHLKNDLNESERKKYLNKYINLPNFSVDKSEYFEAKGAIPKMEELLTITANNYVVISGKRLFITPNIFNHNGKLSKDKPRKYDIKIDYPFVDKDTIAIKIPEGYTTESMPKNLEINNKFGSYKITFSLNNNTIEMIRYNEQNAGKYPKTDYEELVKFYDDMYKADRSKIVLVKKE